MQDGQKKCINVTIILYIYKKKLLNEVKVIYVV